MNKRNKISDSDLFSTGAKTPWIPSPLELEKITKLTNEVIKNIRAANNPRTIIIETWLILDYFVRSFIISGFNLQKNSYDDFDLRYDLLPSGFRPCLNLLKNIIEKLRKLKPNQEINKVDFHGKFAFFIIKHHQNFYNKQFIPLVEKYYQKYYPELLKKNEIKKVNKSQYNINSTNTFMVGSDINITKQYEDYRSVSDEWSKTALMLDDNWFKKAQKINNTRNFAAHSFDSEKIFEELGIKGKNKLAETKKFCINNLSILLDIEI